MTENGNVPRNLRGLPPKPATQNYAIDTDDIKSDVPEFPNLTQTRIPHEEDIYARPTNEGEYEAPASTITRFDNIRRRDENAPRGRSQTNNIYERTSDESQLHGRRYTGYSMYAYASNTDELTSYEHPTECFAYDNPLRVLADEEGNESQSTRPRSRANDVYGTMTSDQSGYTVVGVRNIFGAIEKRRNRRSPCVWFAIIFSCVALLLSGITLHQTIMIRKRVDTVLNKGPDAQTKELVSSSTLPPAKENTTLEEQIVSLERNVSELLAKYNEIKNQTSARSPDISKKEQKYLDDIRKKVEESDVRFKKMNISIWDKLATLRGPRGYNGSRGNTGPQGPRGIQGSQGPRGLTIEGCWYKSVSRNGTTSNPKVQVGPLKNSTTHLYYGMTCKTSLANQALAVEKTDSGTGAYTCTCDNPRPRKFITCTIDCIHCTFLSTTV